MKFIVTLTLVAFLSACSSSQVPPQVVSAVDLNKYAGCWYEIATIPMFVQRGCVATTATYQVQSNESLSIINQCHSKELSGPIRKVEGKAQLIDPSEPAKLQVQFDTWWGIFARGDYWIVMLDPDYQYSVVSGPNRTRLWILSRTPELSEMTYNQITADLLRRGFDLSELKRTVQYPLADLCGSEPV